MLEKLNLQKQYATEKDYKQELKKYQLELLLLQRELHQAGIPVLILFEGWDAAGKGGVIRRLTERLDPRGFQVHSIAAPDGIEAKHHYLWRFWNRLPQKGSFGIFDRSHYGRVLVERVEKLAHEYEWKRAYDEINQFEKLLTDDGYLIMKFWLHISKEEQLRRFEERQKNPFKQWKLTKEDWRNREKWEDYETAIEEMLYRTNTPYAPWTLVEAEYKWYARVKVLQTVVEMIKARKSV